MTRAAANVDLAELRRLSRSTVEERRPVCPSCGTRAPYDANLSWLEAFGHRCPHGEPCPAWGDASEHVTTCVACIPAGSQVAGEAAQVAHRVATEAAGAEVPEPETKGDRMPRPRGKLYKLDGVEQGIADWSRDPRCVVDASVLGQRLRQGWPVLAALTSPKGSTRPDMAKKPATKKRAKKPSKTSAKKAAGDALNELFEGKPRTAHRDTKPEKSGAARLGGGGALDAIVAEVERLEEALPALRAGANAIARLHGLPAPYPEESAA